MSDEYNWDALDTIGTWTALMATLLAGIANWLRRQRQSILTKVASLRASHERHVDVMRNAHANNEGRLIKLETHEMNTVEKLQGLNSMLKELNGKTDEQTKMIMKILEQRRK